MRRVDLATQETRGEKTNEIAARWGCGLTVAFPERVLDADLRIRNVSLAVPVATRRIPRAVWAFVRPRWFSIDLRSLGLFRIAFGLCLLSNLYEHAAHGGLVAFFSNAGVLTNHFALFSPIQPRPWSLLFALSSPAEVAVGFTAIALVYALYTIGWKTRLMQILVIVCFISIVNRNLLLQDGGSFVTTLLAIWTAFLPVGSRFSVDGWLKSRIFAERAPSNDDPQVNSAPAHVSIACFALFAQLAVIYAFNAANKSGVTWRSGTAVHYILWQNSTNTDLAAFIRLHEPRWFSPAFTWGTLLFEWTAPLTIFIPFGYVWSRRIQMAAMWAFHLGIASMLSLGPFAWVMMTYALLLLGPKDWAAATPRLARVWAWLLRMVYRDSAGSVRRTIGGAIRLGTVVCWRLFPRLLAAGFVSSTGARATSASARAATSPFPSPWRRFVITLREAVVALLFTAMFSELTIANGVVPPSLRMEARPAWMTAVVQYLRIYQTWAMFSSDPPLDNGRLVVDAVLADGSHVDPLTNAAPDFEAPLGGPYHIGHDWSEYMYYIPWERHRAYQVGFRDYVLGLQATRQAEGEARMMSFSVFWVSAASPVPGETRAHDVKRERMISWP